ncbi:MAG: carbohydrate ABC transporter permease [Clostridia bacterium]|nr:carbohydrate ABC transporter permease [Clostridia bacterium]
MSELTRVLSSNPIEKRSAVKNLIVKILLYALLILITFITLFPYVWMILTSFKTNSEATSVDLKLFPEVFRIDSFITLSKLQEQRISNTSFLRAMLNTLIIEVTVIPVGTFVAALAAFSFSKMRLPHKRFFLLFLMSGMMVPYAAVLLPQYRAFKAIGWVGNEGFAQLFPLIIPGLFGNVGMMFFFIQYLKSTPKALIEAGRIDGASWLRIFIRIVLPAILPAIAAQVIFWFLGIWNDYFAPSIYLSNEWLTLQALISQLNDSTARRADIPLVMAGSTLGSIPMIIIYVFFQRYFIQSLALTGIKE